ncbi:MAG TPA: hypothetical protein PKV66_02535 [Candidatus Pelethenecus sp.]|nr:hypothetical protein [Candidatus Pelethenecus sp.]
MDIINKRIDEAEKDFKVGVKDIQSQLIVDLKVARDNAKQKTNTLLKELVDDVLGGLNK